MCGLIDNTIDEVRGLATRLRPGVLDDLGLIDALEWYIADFGKRTGIACTFKHRQAPVIDGIGATAAYRIVQEALTNVTRHAEATQVKVSLEPKKGTVILAVADNGRGFDLQEIAASECLGLAGMRRARRPFGRQPGDPAPGPGRGRKCVSDYPPMATGALKMIRVLLADDHDIVRAGLRRLVEDCGDMEVVAEAADGQEASSGFRRPRRR